MAYINNIGLAKATFKHKQLDILQFALAQYNIPERLIPQVERMYERSEIDIRYSAVEDFSLPEKDRTLFKPSITAGIGQRMKVYFEEAPALCKTAIEACIPQKAYAQLTHLITVSCTGMAAPGLDIMLVENLNLPKDVSRTSVNFMGCYAGFHALKLAQAFCAENKNAKVLIVDVELCTLHFQNDYSMDNIAASLLFADGAAAILISNENESSLYKLESFHSELALVGKEDMAWDIGDTGFLMTLSGYVPSILAEYIQPMLNKAIGLNEDIKHWAIHPGGKKILNEIERALSLDADALHISRQILSQYGNMSSATIFFVLEALHQKTRAAEKIFAAGFGPGLTIESAVLSAM